MIKIKIIQGDLFSSSAQTLVNTVNCVGVMGKGIALEFKRQYPEMFEDYQVRCRRGDVQVGRPYLYRVDAGRWVLNFPTKVHWRNKSKIEYVTAGLEYFVGHYREWGVTSVAFPLLGANLGQLDKNLVRETMIGYLRELDIPVEIDL